MELFCPLFMQSKTADLPLNLSLKFKTRKVTQRRGRDQPHGCVESEIQRTEPLREGDRAMKNKALKKKEKKSPKGP